MSKIRSIFKLWLVFVFVLYGLLATTTTFANPNAKDNKDDDDKECDCKTCKNGDGGGGGKTGSIYVWVNFGRIANDTLTLPGKFTIYSKKPTPAIYSPTNLQYVNYLLDKIRIDNDGSDSSDPLPSGVARQVVTFANKRTPLIFNFASGSSTASLSGEKATWNYKMKMLDSNGDETTSSPATYALYIGDGTIIKYSVSTGNVISYQTTTGRILAPSDPTVGLEAIYDAYGNVRQIWSQASGLADVVVADNGVSYEIRIYSSLDAGTKTDGLYVPTGTAHTVWKIENPNPGQNNKVKVTQTINGQSKIWLFTYSYAVEAWTLEYPGDTKLDSMTTSWNYSMTIHTDITTIKSPTGTVASKTSRTYEELGDGERLVVQTDDPDGANRQTVYTYYTGTGDSGSYSRAKTVSYPDGSWVSYEYDSAGRTTVELRPFKNSPFGSAASSARATYYSYTPHDSRDTLTPDDERPRTTEEKVLGITVSKTYNAYYSDSGQYVEIEERCASASAAYGDSSNLKTEKRYYAEGAATTANAGRLYRETYPNGTIKTYTYEYGNWTENPDPSQSTFTAGTGSALRTTIVHGTTASTDGIAYKTTKETIVHDERGNEVFKETYAYTGSGYERIAWKAYTFDGLNRVIEEYGSNNTQKSQTWSSCCKLASETKADGTQYSYSYNSLDQLVSKTRVAATGQQDIVTTYTYDADGKQLTSTTTAGGLSLGNSTEYNLAGQVTRTTDSRNLDTTFSYLKGVNSGSNIKGEVTTVTLPGGGTSTTENYIDGSTLSVTGDAVVAQYYDYGVNADGSTWTMVRTGRNDSARCRKTTTDMLWRTVKVESSGYGGTVTAQYYYNSKSQLIKITQTGQADTLFVYDDLGNRIRSGLDIDASGSLDLASTDRISDTETLFANESSAWWLTNTSKVYAVENDATATTTGISKSRLTGFGTNVVSESKQLDINGNETVSTTSIDRTNKTVTQTVNVPNSSVDAQTVVLNGLVTSQRSPQNLTYTYTYDALGRRTGVTDPRTGQSVIAYYTEGTGKIGQVYTVTDAASNVTALDYYSDTGRRKSVKNALNKYAYSEYDNMGNVVKSWGDTTYPTEMVYNNFGQMTQLKTYRGGSGWTASTWPTGNTGDAELTQWTYDEASGLVTAKTYADSKSVSYTYTVPGQLLTRTWARTSGGSPLVTTYSYDANTGQLIGIDYSDSTTDLAYTHNRLGQNKTVTDAVGSRTFSYNTALQLSSEAITGLYSKTLTKNYETTGVIGRYTGVNISTEYSAAIAYDTYGRMSSVTSGSDAFTYAYLTNSNLIQSITYPNNIKVDNAFEANRNLITQVKNTYNTSTTVSQYDYTYDAIARRTTKSRTGTAFVTPDILTYGYNDRSEVISAVSDNITTYNFGFAFDNIGNRDTSTSSETGSAVQRSYTTNNLNQYTAIDNPSQNLTYNDDGCILTDGNGWNNSWNCENRLIETYNDTVGKKLEFTYDYMGRRVEKKVYTGSSSTSWTLSSDLKFVYDGYKLIEVLDGQNSNAIVQKFTWAGETLLSVYDSAATATYYYFADANKNIGQLMDSSGNIVAKYEYSPFGKLISSSGSYAATNPFRFSSEYHDDETGLVYYNYRYYNPELGRWLNRDPIGERGGINLYAMVGNDAVNKWDYLGKWSKAQCKMSGGTVQGKKCCCEDKEIDPKKQCCNVGFFSEKIESKTSGARYVGVCYSAGFALGGGGYYIRCDLRSTLDKKCCRTQVQVHAVVLGVGAGGKALAIFMPEFDNVKDPSEFAGRAFMGGVSVTPGIGVSIGKLRLGSHWAKGAMAVQAGADIGIGAYSGSSWVTEIDILNCTKDYCPSYP